MLFFPKQYQKKIMKKKNILCLALSIIGFASMAQNSNDTTIEKPFLVGVKSGFGAIAGDGQKFGGSLVYGVFAEKNLSQNFDLGLNLDFGSIDTKAYEGYNYTGTTSFFQVSVLGKYDLAKAVRDANSKGKVSFAPFVGVGMIFYNPQVSQNGKVIRYAAGTADNPTGVSDFIIPVGVELGWKLSDKTKLSFVAQSNFTFTDRLNGTVGVTTPSATLPDGHKFVGKIVDNTNTSSNDIALFLGLKLGFKLGKK
jgi:hypothetical protein